MSQKVSTKSLANNVSKILTDRFELNLKAGFFKDITVEFTRTELRKWWTKTGRIENTSIRKMLDDLTELGYAVRGTEKGENFRVTFLVEEYMTKAHSLQEMEEGNDYLEDILTPVQSEE
ncbi:hypothetical protein D3C85_174650 [compost metagenome]